MKSNIIYNDDCIDILKSKIDKESVDLIFADPPYNLSGNGLHWKGNKTGGDWYMVNEAWDRMTAPEYLQFTRKWIGGTYRALKGGGSIYISCTYHNIAEVMIVLKQLDFKINNVITWQKTNAMPNMTRRVFTHSTDKTCPVDNEGVISLSSEAGHGSRTQMSSFQDTMKTAAVATA